MGWMHDTLDYFGKNPFFRAHHHNNLTFSMLYAFSENYVLPLSHDEVVHGKGSMIGRMPGDYDEQFEQLRAYYAFQLAHPGKKLNFMGHEIAQFKEWNESEELEWFLLDYPAHALHKEFVRAMNNFYLANPAFWEIDTSWDGFEWLSADDAAGNTLAFARRSKDGGEIICLFNFSGEHRNGYRVGVPHDGSYEVLFGTDLVAEGHIIPAHPHPSNGRGVSVEVDLPRYSALFLKRV